MDYSNKAIVELIAEEVANVLQSKYSPQHNSAQTTPEFPKIPLGISSHHIHITPKTFHLLFGRRPNLNHYDPSISLANLPLNIS